MEYLSFDEWDRYGRRINRAKWRRFWRGHYEREGPTIYYGRTGRDEILVTRSLLTRLIGVQIAWQCGHIGVVEGGNEELWKRFARIDPNRLSYQVRSCWRDDLYIEKRKGWR